MKHTSAEVCDFVEACEEPRHKTTLLNDYVRILRVRFPPKVSAFGID